MILALLHYDNNRHYSPNLKVLLRTCDDLNIVSETGTSQMHIHASMCFKRGFFIPLQDLLEVKHVKNFLERSLTAWLELQSLLNNIELYSLLIFRHELLPRNIRDLRKTIILTHCIIRKLEPIQISFFNPGSSLGIKDYFFFRWFWLLVCSFFFLFFRFVNKECPLVCYSVLSVSSIFFLLLSLILEFLTWNLASPSSKTFEVLKYFSF